MSETAIAFECGGDSLVGVLHLGEQPSRRGVLFVVGGGPQYRAGGHRQLTLWARFLAEQGHPAFRFDYRGMGDSHGEFRGFEDVGDDIHAAIDRFVAAVPGGLDEIVLWGECDAASAILFYAYRDARIKGVVLLNPWVHTEAGKAQVMLRFYYLNRLMQPAFWRKVISLRFNPFASLVSLAKMLSQSRGAPARPRKAGSEGIDAEIPRETPLPERLLIGMQRFKGSVMLVLSGRDLIAREFEAAVKASPAWQQQMGRQGLTRHDLPDADHTFSSAAQRQQVARWGLDWLRAW
jgi:uncharacterized protein